MAICAQKTGIVIALILALGCAKENGRSSKDDGKSAARRQIYATNYPVKYFAERIGGDLVDVHFPMSSDGDPAFWQPDTKTVERYQGADVVLLNGATYEKWVDSATLPDSKLIDTSAGFRDKFIQIEDAVTHSHGPEGDHSHAGTVFTTWIDFNQAEQQATAIRDALTKLLPDRETELTTNLNSLLEDLKKLDQAMMDVGKQIGDRPLVASHPVYHYGRGSELNLTSVLWEPDVVPTDEAMAELNKLLESHPAKVMIWEGTPAVESVEKLKAIGVASVVFDPCGNVCEPGDWLSTMKTNIQNLSTWAQAK